MNNTVHRNYTLVIACINYNSLDEDVITEAFKTAQKNNCKWQVLTISQNDSNLQSNKSFQRIIKKAEILGAYVANITTSTIDQGILKYSESFTSADENILFLTRQDEELKLPILTKKSAFAKTKQILNERKIEIKSVTAEKQTPVTYPFILPIFNYNALSGILETVIYILIATLISLIFYAFIPQPSNISGITNLYLIYLIACVMSALRAGMFAGIISSIISAVTINFLFVEPRLSMSFEGHANLISSIIFLSCALAISLISGGTRRYIIEAKQQQAYLNALLNISETLNRPLDEKEALAYIYNELKKLFSTELAFYGHSLMKGDILDLKYPEDKPEFNEIELKAYEKCRTEYVSSGFLTSNFPASRWHFEPMLSSNGFKGILAVKLANSTLRFDTNVTQILLSFTDFSATLIDRIERTLSLEENKLQHEKEQLRTMLLSSVSHDLKTPLASIIGSLDVYESLNAKLSEENKKTLLQTAHDEAVRLDNFITNILDMAKLESGSVKINKSWVSLSSVLDKGLSTISPRFKGRQIFNETAKSNIEINVEPTLLTRALVNIFDNISKYTPQGSNMFISSKTTDQGLSITISDEGPGIEEGMLEEIFNKYTRVKHQDAKIAGTGLGLPIARFILRAHGGDITAANQDNGMLFNITLPEYVAK